MATAAGPSNHCPLASYQIASTKDPDEAAEVIAHSYCGHEVRILDPVSSVHFRFCEARLAGTAVGAMSFDADIHYDLGQTENYFLIQLADKGAIEYVNGGRVCEVTPHQGMVTSPTRPLQIRYDKASRGTIFKIRKTVLENHLGALTGVAIGRPLIFDAEVPRGSLFSQRYKRLLHYLLSELDADSSFSKSLLLIADLEDLFMTTLLTCQPHNYSMRFEVPVPSAGLHQVERVEDFIRTDPTRPFAAQDFVTLTGVSGRALYRAFQKHRGYPPMAFVRAMRLHLARERLCKGEQGVTVTQVAQECGFDHLGRFSLEYAKRFAESPSRTLKYARCRRP